MKNPAQFLSTMRERYGISEEFATEASPLIASIYGEFDGKQRADLLEFAESIFAQQAATEQAFRSSTSLLRDAAGKLERVVGDFSRAVETLRKAAAQLRPVEAPAVPRWQLN